MHAVAQLLEGAIRRGAAPSTTYLQSTDSSALEAQICFEVLSNFTHQTLEGKFADQKFGRLLIAPDLTESHSTRPLRIDDNNFKKRISIQNIILHHLKVHDLN